MPKRVLAPRPGEVAALVRAREKKEDEEEERQHLVMYAMHPAAALGEALEGLAAALDDLVQTQLLSPSSQQG